MPATVSKMRDINLSNVVAGVCESNPDIADPSDLADLVLDKIDPADYKEALRQALHRYLPSYVVATRPTRGADDPTVGSVSGRRVGKSRLSGLGAFLSSREFSPYRGRWILLAEATVDDLRSMVEKREAVAAMYLAKSKWYSEMADTVEAYEVATVGDLPVTVQASLMEGTPPTT